MWPSRFAAWLGFSAGVLLVVGCPPREVRLDVTPGGVAIVRSACVCTADCCAAPVTVGDRLELQLHLVTVDGNQVTIESSSGCAGLDLVLDGRDDQLERQAEQVNGALAQAIGGDGLGFDGLDDPDQTTVLVTLHLPGMTPCDPGTLLACAGMSEPLPDADYFDITCASCRGGNRNFTSSSPPCIGECFVEFCEQLLRQTTATRPGT